MTAPVDPVPGWQRWLVPEVPRLSHFLVGAGALLLPAGAGVAGPDSILVAMGIATIVGGGLGLGWLLACSPRWLRRAPVMATGVLGMSLGCFGHLAVMPRWEVLLRANTAISAARAWLAEDPQARSLLPPTYASGDGPVRFALTDQEPVTLFTPQALTRWSPFGRSESCYIVVRQGHPAQVVRTSAERDALLAAPVTTP